MPSITGVPYVGNPAIDVQEHFNLKYDISKLYGKHAFKMGYDLLRLRRNNYTITNDAGTFTLATTAWISSMLRDANRTLELTDEAIVISTKYSFEVARSWAISSQGWALARNGDEKGIGRLREGLAATQATGAALNNTYTLALLAESYLRYGRIDEGLDAVAEAQRLAETQGERFWTAELSRLKGELLLGRDSPPIEEAEQCFQKALTIARSQHAFMLELRAATGMAKLLKALNRVEDARRLLGSVRARFNERADCGDLHDAQTVLDQLRT